MLLPHLQGDMCRTQVCAISSGITKHAELYAWHKGEESEGHVAWLWSVYS